MLVLGPGNACGKQRDENIRISTHSAPRVTARSSLAESRADQMRSGGFGKNRTNRGKLPGKKSSPFLRSLVGATAESDRWPSSLVAEGACLAFSSIGSADCVFRMPSVAASTSSDRPAIGGRVRLKKKARFRSWSRPPRRVWPDGRRGERREVSQWMFTARVFLRIYVRRCVHVRASSESESPAGVSPFAI